MPLCGGGRNEVRPDKLSDLMSASYTGNVNRMKVRIKSGENVNNQDQSGMTPLHRAAQIGSSEAIGCLMQNNANPRAKSKTGETPLHLAVFHRNLKAVQDLILTDAKKDINTQASDHGMTPFHVAIYRGCPEISQLLLQNGADTSITDNYGQTCLQMAFFWNEQESVGLSSPSARHKDTLLLIKRMQGDTNEFKMESAEWKKL
eukprot:GHVS01055007.1.p1 GENE.GHVS01055007.1~~GHVS01055007.1.p1  ORF type:complete len:214 (-),score=30.47 GHVS01055007.1:275-883(-)